CKAAVLVIGLLEKAHLLRECRLLGVSYLKFPGLLRKAAPKERRRGGKREFPHRNRRRCRRCLAQCGRGLLRSAQVAQNRGLLPGEGLPWLHQLWRGHPCRSAPNRPDR